jgi:2-hydroxy-6-oxonona-2,4-dienedioate hydrolase
MDYSSVWTDLENVGFCQRWIDVNGVRTRFLASGTEADNPSLIFVHGFGGSAEAYCRNLGPHSRYFRTFALDMVGHGWTQKPDLRMDMTAYVDHLVRFLDVMKIDNAHISGEGLGGRVAARFALEHPDRLDRLVLNSVASAVIETDSFAQFTELFQRALENPNRSSIEAILTWSLADPEKVSDDLIALHQAIYSSEGFKRAMMSTLGLTAEPDEGNLPSLEAWHAIKAPTLVLGTTHNRLSSMSEGHQISARIPGASFVVMENCGRWPQFEDALRFNSLHIDFLVT